MHSPEGARIICKRGASPVEVAFYRDYSTVLNDAGIYVPRCLNLDEAAGRLELEHIPDALPELEVYRDEKVIRQLARLHEFPPLPNTPTHLHTWSLNDTESALRALAMDAETERYFYRAQAQSAVLFEHHHLISGDTTPGNWGVRRNGQRVLFDWERFSLGCAAIDLAPMIPGMGNADTIGATCRHYRCYRATVAQGELELRVVLAKSWIVVEVVNILQRCAHPDTERYLTWYRQTLPGWAKEMRHLM